MTKMKFTMMKFPLKHDVRNGSKILIPAGTSRVYIAFRQSHLVRDNESGRIYSKPFAEALEKNEQRLNVYHRYQSNHLIHA